MKNIFYLSIDFDMLLVQSNAEIQITNQKNQVPLIFLQNVYLYALQTFDSWMPLFEIRYGNA